MNAPALLRKGWCPGALRPMPTGDGLLLRIRAPGGRLSLDRAQAIGDCAAQFGNGAIEISSRANLQLRGIREAGLPSLQRLLDELGLLDADIALEGVRNIVASPLADIDPGAILDTGPIVAALEARLGADARLHGLPAKFGFLIDGGGALPLGDVEADIRFEAYLGDEAEPRFALTLAEDRNLASVCAPQDVSSMAAALVSAFLRCAGTGHNPPRRMRGLIERHGAAAIFGAAGIEPSAPPTSVRRRAAHQDFLGIRKFGASFCVGAAPPLGRMTADDLCSLVEEARRALALDIRLTPWRALLVTGLAEGGAENLAAALARLGFIVDPGDPRLAVVACSGAPACANAARAVQAEALEFAALIPSGAGIVLHVSGCEKGCAHGQAAAFTLVSRPAGYDLVRNGKASDEPLRRGLTKDEIGPLLAQFAEESS
jgi:precorrin-3B synthase